MQPFRPFRKWTTISKTSFLQMLNIDSITLNLPSVSVSSKINLELSYLEKISKKIRHFQSTIQNEKLSQNRISKNFVKSQTPQNEWFP